VLAGIPEQRFNDGCVDAAGRFWLGSVTSDKANPGAMLFRLDPDGELTPIIGGLLTSNGAAFSPDGRTFYHADTPTHALNAYDVDPLPENSATAASSTSSNSAPAAPTAAPSMPRAATGRRCGTAGASSASRPRASCSRPSSCPSSARR
jgi:sugar lactone lactonase YvrE